MVYTCLHLPPTLPLNFIVTRCLPDFCYIPVLSRITSSIRNPHRHGWDLAAYGTPSVCQMVYLVRPPTTGSCVIDCTSVGEFSVLCVTEYSIERMSKHNAPHKTGTCAVRSCVGCHVSDGHSGGNVQGVLIVWSILR